MNDGQTDQLFESVSQNGKEGLNQRTVKPWLKRSIQHFLPVFASPVFPAFPAFPTHSPRLAETRRGSLSISSWVDDSVHKRQVGETNNLVALVMIRMETNASKSAGCHSKVAHGMGLRPRCIGFTVIIPYSVVKFQIATSKLQLLGSKTIYSWK